MSSLFHSFGLDLRHLSPVLNSTTSITSIVRWSWVCGGRFGGFSLPPSFPALRYSESSLFLAMVGGGFRRIPSLKSHSR